MSVVVTKQLPLIPSTDLWEFVGTGDPSVAPGVPAAIGSRFIRTDGALGSVEYRKFGALDTDWENALGGSGSGSGSGVSDITAVSPISVDVPTGSVTVSHDASGVTPGTYGDATHVAVPTVDATGHVTAVTTVAISGATDTSGNPEGRPGNLALTLSAGGAVIVDAWPSATTRIAEFDVSPVSLNADHIGAIKIECPIIVAGPSGAWIALRGLAYAGGPFDFLDLVSGPFVAADAVNESGGVVLAVPGDYVAIDPSLAIDNLQIEVVIGGGDDATPGVFGNVYVISASADTGTVPPSGTPDPEIPGPTDGLIAYWAPTEGSGQIVANKSPGVGTADLILGDTTSADGRDPSWATSPRRLATIGFGGGGIDHLFCHYDGLPSSLANGCAIFMYVDITTLGGLAKFFCGIGGGGGDSWNIGVNGSNKLFARINEDTGGGTYRTATGTTSIVNGSKHWVGLLHDGTTLGVYVDPADGLPEATVACSTAHLSGLSRDFILGAGGRPPTLATGPDVCAFGDVILYVGSAVSGLTPAKIAEMYAHIKLTFTALP